MKSVLRTALLLTTSLALAATANAAGVYIKAQAMFNNPGDVETNSITRFRASMKDSVAYSGSLGYRFSILRLEGEIQHFKQDAAQGSDTAGAAAVTGGYSQLAGFANAFADIPLVGGLGIYAGGGLGFARVSFDNFSASQSGSTIVQYSGKENAFAYQVAAGAQFSFASRASLFAGYRIVKQEDVEVRDAFAAAVQSVKLGENRLFEIGLAIGF